MPVHLEQTGVKTQENQADENSCDERSQYAASRQTAGRIQKTAEELQIEIEFYQSNHEGCLCDKVAESIGHIDGIVINPAAYTHTSVALRDALEAARIPAVEVHLSNINARDEFRKISLTAPVCIGQIAGLGADGYEWALRALVRKLQTEQSGKEQ